MKPNFALSLSFEGIKLLHRAAGGWREVGDVPVTAEDLGGELAMLRKTAASLEPAGVRTKLIIPASQIKYVTIDTPGLSEAARRKEAETALHNATPYEVSELAYDISLEGQKTHIAAVAHETLAEAEAFATEHRFHPVSFVAVPGEAPYLGEPFFGMTSEASKLLEPGETVDADGIAVVVVGAITPEFVPPRRDPEPEKAEAPEPAAKPETEAKPEPAKPEAARAALLAAAAASGPTQQAIAPQRPLNADALTPQASTAAAPQDEKTPAGFASRRNAPLPNGAAKPVGGAQRIAARTPTPDSSSLTKPANIAASTAAAAAPVAAATRSIGGFLSRRKPRTGAAVPLPAPTISAPAASTEVERMTVFGARSEQVGGKPRFLGLIMTVILLVFLAGVAAWAAVFLDDGLASLIQKDKTRATASAPENQIDPEVIRTPDGIDPAQTDTTADVQIAALDPVLSAEETAVVDAAQTPRAEPEVLVITEAEAAARYAVTGIWPLAPETPLADPDTIDPPVFRSGIDPVRGASDAFALPAPQDLETDVQLAAAISPPPFGQTTATDAAGLIVPTPTGVVTPGGYTLFLASPPLKPPATLARFAAQSTVTAPEATSALAALRPQNRPLGLSERSERAQLGGMSRGELAAFRPSLRPRSIQDRAQGAEEDAQKATEQDEARAKAAAESSAAAAAAALLVPTTPTAPAAPAAPAPIVATHFATVQSKRPDTRPRNFSRIVQRAQRAAPQKETRVAAATVAPRTVTPSLPSKASVARSATVKNAINLRKVNLIGIYGKPSSRRALIRLGNGRYQKVKVGDRIDGGRVAAISNSELRYSKGGRNVVLKMP